MPVAGPRDVVIRVDFCGICGTDLGEYVEGPIMIRLEPHPLTGEMPPIALGHEFSGRVSSVGTEVDDLTVGAPVTADPCLSCGTCYWCRRGDYHICAYGGAIGLAASGGLADYVRVPAARVVKLPDAVDTYRGALAEPFAVALHALDRARVKRGDRILISGFGPVGAAILLAGKALGIDEVLVSEPVLGRRARAMQLGATEALDPTRVSVRREVFQRTSRVGPDAVFECSGARSALADSLNTVRRGGCVVAVGIGHHDVTFNPQRLIFFERELVGSIGYRNDVGRAVELMAAGHLTPERLVTDRIALEDAAVNAFEALAVDRGEKLKILIDVGGVGN